jgi:diphthamide biosynthesis protein 2
VACPEHSLLDDDKEYHVPVLTPLELAMALGDAEWGVTQYSLDIQDFLQTAAAVPATIMRNKNLEDEDEDADAPYFSLVTGRYESAPAQTEGVDLTALPGQGQLARYNSAAAAHLKQREYQGMQVLAGKTEGRPAVLGDHGIASDYGDR